MKNRDRTLKKDRTFNIILPVKNSNREGVFSLSTTSIEKYKSNLYNLLFTGLGQRVMVPTFGTRIPLLLFENSEEDLYQNVRSEIVSSVSRWIPEIVIKDIQFKNEASNLENNRIDMTIKFALKKDETVQQMIEIEFGV